MSEVLAPKVGDKVRFVHTSGDEFSGTVCDISVGSDGTRFYDMVSGATWEAEDGWSVAEIVEKALPPAGTFVKGTYATLFGVKDFVGVYVDGVFKVITEHGSLIPLNQVLSWEAIDA